MEINIIRENNLEIIVINNRDILIKDVQSALDFIATVRYEIGCNSMIFR